MAVNLLALVHGITPDPYPHPREQYKPMLRGLQQRGVRMDAIVEVEWGQGGSTLKRPDQYLSAAERHVSNLVSWQRVKHDESNQNHLAHDLLESVGVPVVRQLALSLRERLVQFGLADAVYYASEDGERAIRNAVYQQILGALAPYQDQDDVRLHLVAHSLGVTVAHDFLFGLFAPGHEPDFYEQADTSTHAERYRTWRKRAQAQQLKLGTFVALASQLPLFVLRRQPLVELLAQGRRLDPTVIGIRPGERRVRWINFYDIDDVLGFASRSLYEPIPAIVDHQVKTGVEPLSAHTRYFCDGEVIDEAAELLAANVG